jgi:hypothetical protein
MMQVVSFYIDQALNTDRLNTQIETFSSPVYFLQILDEAAHENGTKTRIFLSR